MYLIEWNRIEFPWQRPAHPGGQPSFNGSWYGNSDARCALFTCVEYNARGRSAKKAGGTSVEYANDIRVIDGRGGQLFQSLDTGRVSARHYSPDSNIACRFASDVP